MPLEILTYVLGPIENNSYLAADTATREAAVIDPSYEAEILAQEAQARGWHIGAIWLTHAHFDHFGGVQALKRALGAEIPVGLHPDDLPLWRERGGADAFGFPMELGTEPELAFSHGQRLTLGSETLEVRHTPGHSLGHVVIYAPSAAALFSGDLLFRGSVGRTDLPGASHSRLLKSIEQQVLTLPDETRVLPGHGDETTVGAERRGNPFLQG